MEHRERTCLVPVPDSVTHSEFYTPMQHWQAATVDAQACDQIQKISTVKDKVIGFSCISDIRETAYMSTLPNTLPKENVAKLFTKTHK